MYKFRISYVALFRVAVRVSTKNILIDFRTRAIARHMQAPEVRNGRLDFYTFETSGPCNFGGSSAVRHNSPTFSGIGPDAA